MKASAPEKLYISNIKKRDTEKCYSATIVKYCDDDIEFIRTDAFIKKAETYLKEQFIKDVSVLAGGVVHINFDTAINNFVNYMKGE